MAQKQELQRELGLWSIIAISMGAMIGSGIFILPGLAMAEAGPAVILAFILAAILVVPAAVSIAELGTAMPEAGGDYVFIERGMGPAAGTIAGLGTWLMLMFKGALALVGGMFYLKAVMSLPSVEAVAVVIGTILIAVNVFGVKQTGGLQTVMVIVMVLILGGFVSVSLIHVENTHYQPFFADDAMGGLMTATAMVLVSYAGVTKVAAVAEEIEDPGRNLPLGLLLSMGVTTVLYALIVFVLVGIIEGEALAGSNIPMVDAVEPFFGFTGVVLIVVAAMLALISTANAGILTASRYPFALSRDKLLPPFFGKVHDGLHTPVVAILITGGAMLAIIIFLPVEEIAKTAGSFQIIVYILVNIALIAFRTSSPEWYDPDFKSPLYPWVQIFGIVSGVGILTQMDTLPLVGGVGIVVGGTLWYLLYAKSKVDREGIIGEALAVGIDMEPSTKPYRVIVPVASRENLEGLIKLAAASAIPHANAEIIPVNVVKVPDQTSLSQEIESEVDRMQEQQDLLDEAVRLAEELGFAARSHPIVGRDIPGAILSVIKDEEADEVILSWKGKRNRREHILGSFIDPIVQNARCEVTLVKLRCDTFGDTVAFITDGPYAKVTVMRAAELVASEEGATLTLANVELREDGKSEEELRRRGEEIIEADAAQAGLHPDDYRAKVIIADDVEDALLKEAENYRTVCIGATQSKRFERVLFGAIPEKIGEQASATVVIVQAEDLSRRSLWTVLKERFFGA